VTTLSSRGTFDLVVRPLFCLRDLIIPNGPGKGAKRLGPAACRGVEDIAHRISPTPVPAFDRYVALYQKWFAAKGLRQLGPRLPRHASRAGLEDVRLHVSPRYRDCLGNAWPSDPRAHPRGVTGSGLTTVQQVSGYVGALLQLPPDTRTILSLPRIFQPGPARFGKEPRKQ